MILTTLALTALLPANGRTQAGKYKTLGYRSCGTGQNACHVSDGDWWRSDPHFKTISDLKRKQQRSMQIAQTYGMKAGDYLLGGSRCGDCHGEVVSGRESRAMNTGVSCESCHGPSGPNGAGYFEVHQEGARSKDPLDVSRSGYQKALKVGLVELRKVAIRAGTCVRCHQISEKKLLEAGHPTGEGFDYLGGIKKDISKHWDYAIRPTDIDQAPFAAAVQRKPIPAFTLKITNSPAVSGMRPAVVVRDTVVIYKNRNLPAWLNPNNSTTLESFDPRLSHDAPVDSILQEIKRYIEYVHQCINDNR